MLGSWFSHTSAGAAKTAAKADEAAVATLDDLRRFEPFSALEDGLLQELLPAVSHRHLVPASEIFHFGERDDSEYFLLAGELELVAADGRIHRIAAGTPVASHEIARLQPRQYSARAAVAADVLVIPRAALTALQEKMSARHIAHYGVEEMNHRELAPESEELLLLRAFREALSSGRLSLPALPKVIQQTRKLLATSEDSVVIARVIGDSPILEHYIVQATNSQLFTSTDPCIHCVMAIERLGVASLQDILPAFAPILLLNDHKVGESVRTHWQHSLAVAGVACWLAERTKLVPVEQAFVASLLHNAGMLVLEGFLDSQQTLELDDAEVQKVMPLLLRDITAILFEQWQVPPLYTQMLPVVYNWRLSSATMKPDIADILQAARYLVLRRQNAAGLPRPEQAAAVSKVMLHEQQLLNDRAVWPDISRMQVRIERIFAR